MVILELLEMINKHSSVQQDKGLLYTQQGFDIDNVPVPTEQKGIDHDELIGCELSGIKPKLPPVEKKPVTEWVDDKSNRPEENAAANRNSKSDNDENDDSQKKDQSGKKPKENIVKKKKKK